jgi:hypothetical protein
VRYQQDRSTATDALFNHMSAFIQALGRVERVWQSTPDQTVLLSREVYHRFLAFCTPEYEPLRQERDPIISNNLRQLFALVEESRSHREREVRRRKDARLEAKMTAAERPSKTSSYDWKAYGMATVIVKHELSGRNCVVRC